MESCQVFDLYREIKLGVMTPLLLRTAAKWKIPRELALTVIERDLRCIYCNREFGEPQGPRAACASWEHIVNDESIVNLSNIALCCVGCNASKGTKPHLIRKESKHVG